nr:MAG TPA: hypothetical protein [Caudoviricetes sp.]
MYGRQVLMMEPARLFLSDVLFQHYYDFTPVALSIRRVDIGFFVRMIG